MQNLNDLSIPGNAAKASMSAFGSEVIGAGATSTNGQVFTAITIQKKGTITGITCTNAKGESALYGYDHAEGKTILGLGNITSVTSGTAVLQLHRASPSQDNA